MPSSREAPAGGASTAARTGLSVGRVALLPVRAMGRASVAFASRGSRRRRLVEAGREVRQRGRKRVEDLTVGMLEAPEAGRVADRALAGPLPEAIARALVEHGVAERMAREFAAQPDLGRRIEEALDSEATHRLVDHVLASPAFERLLLQAFDSRLTADLTDRVLRSPEFEQAMERALSSPAVRRALAKQSAGLADELRDNMATAATKADDTVERTVHRWLRRPVGPAAATYGGFVSRGIGLAVDIGLAQLAFLATSALVALIASLVGGLHPHWVAQGLAGVGWFAIVGGYFVVFWSGAGQTPAMRLFRLRLQDAHGNRPGLARATIRLIGLWLSILLLGAGFLPALVDRRRRALQDFLAGTVIIRRAEDEQLLHAADERAESGPSAVATPEPRERPTEP